MSLDQETYLLGIFERGYIKNNQKDCYTKKSLWTSLYTILYQAFLWMGPYNGRLLINDLERAFNFFLDLLLKIVSFLKFFNLEDTFFRLLMTFYFLKGSEKKKNF